MKVYRLSKKKYATFLSGMGAAKYGNRWNSKGTEIIYTAESRALAMAEVAVHLSLATLPCDYVMMEIEIPNDIKIDVLDLLDLPTYWNSHPPHPITQKIGDTFINDSEFCVLKIPSAVVQGDYNFLLNPHHPLFRRITISGVNDFPFDKRLFT